MVHSDVYKHHMISSITWSLHMFTHNVFTVAYHMITVCIVYLYNCSWRSFKCSWMIAGWRYLSQLKCYHCPMACTNTWKWLSIGWVLITNSDLFCDILYCDVLISFNVCLFLDNWPKLWISWFSISPCNQSATTISWIPGVCPSVRMCIPNLSSHFRTSKWEQPSFAPSCHW